MSTEMILWWGNTANSIRKFPNGENSLHSWDMFSLASDSIQMSAQGRLEKKKKKEATRKFYPLKQILSRERNHPT